MSRLVSTTHRTILISVIHIAFHLSLTFTTIIGRLNNSRYSTLCQIQHNLQRLSYQGRIPFIISPDYFPDYIILWILSVLFPLPYAADGDFPRKQTSWIQCVNQTTEVLCALAIDRTVCSIMYYLPTGRCGSVPLLHCASCYRPKV